MRKRVLLIFPPDVNCVEPFLSSGKKQPPLLFGFPIGLGYIAAYLRVEGGYECRIIDGNKDNLSIREILNRIEDFDPQYIGISTYTINSKVTVKLAEAIKSLCKDRIIIAGGPHASDTYESLLKIYPYFDYIVVGEGEVTTLELLRCLDSGDFNRLKEVKGIAYLDKPGKNIVFTGRRSLSVDIDKLPIPARDLVDFNSYIIKDNLLPYSIEVMGSRGCSHRCAFCSFQKVWRARNVEGIISELKGLINSYPIVKSFMFFDDNFSVNKDRVVNLCRALIKEGLNKYMWSCLCRVDQVTEEMLRCMRSAGCVKIMYGVETADPEVMRNINKRISLDQVRRAFELTIKIGIDALAFFIIGNPGDTAQSIYKSYNFAKKLRCHSTVWSIMQVYPGTALAKIQPREDFVSYIYEPEIENPSDFASANVPVFENPGLDREKLKIIHKKIFRRVVFYKALQHPFFIIKKVTKRPAVALGFLSVLLQKKQGENK